MKQIKKTLVALFTLTLLLGLVGTAMADSVNFPVKPITVIVPYAAGGGTDTGVRLLCAEVEKILKTPIAVINQPGAGGWIGWQALLAAEKDGYTLASFNTPNLMAGYLDPQQARKNSLDDFAPIYQYVSDYGAIGMLPTETRFSNLEELIAYAKENEITCTTTGAISDDQFAILKMNEALGTKFVPVITKGAGDGLPAVLGGHIDLYLANVGEVKPPHDNGELVCIGVLAEERSVFFPDVPTIHEVTGKMVTSFSARGIGAAAGVDPAILKILQDAFSEGAQAESFKENMARQGLALVTYVGDDYMARLKQEEADPIAIAPLLGWE